MERSPPNVIHDDSLGAEELALTTAFWSVHLFLPSSRTWPTDRHTSRPR